MENKDDIQKKYNELYKKQLEDRKEKQMAHMKELWGNLKPFETPEDVPDIPVVDEKEYKEFYVPRLIAAGAIPKKDLVDEQIYIGQHRRCKVARWDAKEEEFRYWRNKFGQKFIDTCNHFEDDDGFALFVPIKLGTEADFEKTKI